MEEITRDFTRVFEEYLPEDQNVTAWTYMRSSLVELRLTSGYLRALI